MANYDWEGLKGKYVRGNIKSVQKFFRANNLTFSGQASLKTSGWRSERESYQKSIQEEITENARRLAIETEQQVRERQAKVAKHLQFKAIKAVRHQEPRNAMESLRMWEIGVKLERSVLGYDTNRHKEEVSSINTAIMGTRYYKKLSSAFENGTLRETIQELERLSSG